MRQVTTNTTASMTAKIDRAAKAAVSAGTQILAVISGRATAPASFAVLLPQNQAG
jgi:Asp/Glu/hydantoin racemase